MSEASSGTPVLGLLTAMTAESIEASSLDGQTLMLIRIAALVAVDAAPSSYLMNLGAAGEVGLDAEDAQGVLAAVAPIVGTARVMSGTGNIARALGLAIELAEIEVERGAVKAVRPCDGTSADVVERADRNRPVIATVERRRSG